MKKKLNLIELSKVEEKNVKGGYIIDLTGPKECGCACAYAGQPGGSSTYNNRMANKREGLASPIS